MTHLEGSGCGDTGGTMTTDPDRVTCRVCLAALAGATSKALSPFGGVLRRVELQTRDGDHVCLGFIPPFTELPAVVVLPGGRTFQLVAKDAVPLVYREVFAYVIVETRP